MRITQVSSGLTTTQAFNSVPAAAWAAAARTPGFTSSGRWNPRASPPPAAAAEPTMNLRREVFASLRELVLFMSGSLVNFLTRGLRGRSAGAPGYRLVDHMNDGAGPLVGAGRKMDGGPDALVGAAAADVGHRG